MGLSPTHPFCSSHPPCSAILSPLQPHPPLPSFICFSFKMPPLFPSRSDFTLTSPILRLMPEQRHFPHFVTGCLDGAAEVFIVHLYPEPLNSVSVYVKVRRSSPIWWLVEPLWSLDGYTRSFVCMKGQLFRTNGTVGRLYINRTSRTTIVASFSISNSREHTSPISTPKKSNAKEV